MKPLNNNLTLKRLISDFMDVLEMRRGIIKTLFFLSFNPKHVISGYIEDRKGNFSGPIKIFYVGALFWILSLSIVDYGNNEEYLNWYVGNHYKLSYNHNVHWTEGYKLAFDAIQSSKLKNELRMVSDFINKVRLDINPLYTLPITLIFFSIFTYLVNRNYYTTFLNHLCANLYIISIVMIINIIINVLVCTITSEYYYFNGISLTLTLGYCIFVTYRSFNLENLYLKIIMVLLMSVYNPITLSWSADPALNPIIAPLNHLSYHCIKIVYLPILDWYFS